MTRLEKLRTWLFTPKSRFNVGDSVQLIGGDYQLMVVIEICYEPRLKELLIHCQWMDPKIGTRKNLFAESSLEPFDWYHVHRNEPGKLTITSNFRAENAPSGEGQQ